MEGLLALAVLVVIAAGLFALRQHLLHTAPRSLLARRRSRLRVVAGMCLGPLLVGACLEWAVTGSAGSVVRGAPGTLVAAWATKLVMRYVPVRNGAAVRPAVAGPRETLWASTAGRHRRRSL